MTDNWTVNGSSLLWTEDDWSGLDGLPPTSGESAFIGTNSGTALVFLTNNLNETVASIGTSFLDTLAISGNANLTAKLGTGSSANAGTITISDISGLTIGTGDFDNTGIVMLEAFDSDFASGGNVQLTGGGEILMLDISGSVNNVIQGAAPTDEITNVDNYISGAGTIEAVVFVNDSDGVIEATPGKTFTIVGSAYGGSFENAGEMLVDDHGVMVLGIAGRTSTIGLEVGGMIQVAAGSHITELEIAGDVTINSEGQIDMQGGVPSNDYFVSNGAACVLNLEGGGTVSGAGTLGDANMTLTIGSITTVDADNGAGGSGNTTLIITTGGNTITNDGVLEATNGGTMDIRSAVNNSGVIQTTGGTLYVRDAIAGPGSVTVVEAGALNVLRGGSVTGLKLYDPNDPDLNALATIKSGATVDGNTKINGGELILDAGATFEPNAKLTIMNGGELLLERDSFAGSIRDFGGSDTFDLTRISFVGQTGSDPTTATWTQTNSAGGQLQVTGGTHVVDLQLTGTYTTANFALASDGAHGTAVTFVP